MTALSDAFEWAWAEGHDLLGLADDDGLRRWLVRGMLDRGLRLRRAEQWADDILRCVLDRPPADVASPAWATPSLNSGDGSSRPRSTTHLTLLSG